MDKQAPLSPDRQRLLELRLKGAAGAPVESHRIPRRPAGQLAPLSAGQHQMWVVDQMLPGNPAYNIPFAYRIRGELDVHALEECLNQIIQRHESWRTTFREFEGDPVQEIHPECRIEICITDIAHLPAEERETKLGALAAEEGERPFDLRRLPLIRVSLFKLGDAGHVLLINLHHIICDHGSCAIFARELTAFYAAFRSGQPNPLPELALQYADYAQWQRGMCGDAAVDSHLAFWRARLGGDRPPLAVPADHPRPARQSHRGGMRIRDFSGALATKVRDLAREEGVTLFILTLASFKALLARYCHETDICIGSPIAQRPNVETEGLIGYFLNMLALRSDLSGDPDFRELLRRVRSTVLDAFQNQDVPFQKIVEDLHPSRNLSHHPVFQVAFVLMPTDETVPSFAGTSAVPFAVPVTTAKFDLTLFIEETPDGMRAMMEYSADQFEAATADRMLESLELLLEGIVADPSTPLSRLPILSAAQRQRILTEWSGSARPYPEHQTIAARFAEVAAETPGAIAVIEGDGRLTYAELDARADRVAHFLQSRGIRAGEFVGLRAGRSLSFVVKLLGIAKAGAAYVPLDEKEPATRLETMKAACALIIDEEPEFDAPSDPITSAAHAGGPAYMLFTSGSTGVPKGVIVPHRGITRLVVNNDYAPFQPDDVVAFASNVCFDAATFEIWGALLNGGALVVTPPDVLLSAAALAEHLARHRVTTLFLTTSLFNQIAQQSPAMFRGLRTMVFGGEAADAHSVRLVLENGRPQRLVNGYGPTEATTFAVCHVVEQIAGPRVPIGRPIANTTAFILNAALQPVPIGVSGELHIGGPGVALGYHAAPELTAERFISTEFGRLYRTGDLARWLADGTIDCLGRADQQVKLRGFRVEPGEIEAALRGIPGIGDSAVVPRETAPGNLQLVAYFTPNGVTPPAAEEIRKQLQRVLPAWMVPGFFVRVERLPLTPNGKLDVPALPTPGADAAPGTRFAPPENTLHAQLIEIWEELLEHRPIGIRDHFFDLGGHSLLAARMLTLIEERLGRRVAFGALFERPTIEHIAGHILTGQEESALVAPMVAIHADGPERPFFFLHGDYVGGGFFCRTLAQQIGADRPFHAIHPHGLHGDRPLATFEAMAESRLADVRRVQPHGPYLLGGYCNGAMVAFEMARRLTREGESVGALILLAADGSNARFSHLQSATAFFGGGGEAKRQRFLNWRRRVVFLTAMRREYAAAIADWLKQPAREQVQRLANKIRRVLRRLGIGAGASLAEPLPDPPQRREVYAAYNQAFAAYVPGVFDGTVTLLWPKDEPPATPHGAAAGWDKVCRETTLILVPGEHHSSVSRHSSLVEIGEQIRIALAATPAPNPPAPIS